jgi:hypothetical protein
MIIGMDGSIKHWPEASKQPINSQSWVSHESVMSQSLVMSGGATMGPPLVTKGSIFFQQNFTVTIRWVNWTCLKTFWGQTRHLKFWHILGWTPYQSNTDGIANAACPGLPRKPLDATIWQLLAPHRPSGRQGNSKQHSNKKMDQLWWPFWWLQRCAGTILCTLPNGGGPGLW